MLNISDAVLNLTTYFYLELTIRHFCSYWKYLEIIIPIISSKYNCIVVHHLKRTEIFSFIDPNHIKIRETTASAPVFSNFRFIDVIQIGISR